MRAPVKAALYCLLVTTVDVTLHKKKRDKEPKYFPILVTLLAVRRKCSRDYCKCLSNIPII